MTKVSLGLIVVLLIIGIVINVWQGGQANLATVLGYTPLVIYLVLCIISWFLAPKR